MPGGVFLRPKLKGDYQDFSFIPSSVFVWMLSALVLLIVSSVILNESGCSERSMGYVSSILSFSSAMAAGITAGRKRKAGALYTALLTASVLVVMLLTIGFMISSTMIEPSAVMSLVSFTFAGCLVGVVCFLPSNKRKKRYRPQP